MNGDKDNRPINIQDAPGSTQHGGFVSLDINLDDRGSRLDVIESNGLHRNFAFRVQSTFIVVRTFAERGTARYIRSGGLNQPNRIDSIKRHMTHKTRRIRRVRLDRHDRTSLTEYTGSGEAVDSGVRTDVEEDIARAQCSLNPQELSSLIRSNPDTVYTRANDPPVAPKRSGDDGHR